MKLLKTIRKISVIILLVFVCACINKETNNSNKDTCKSESTQVQTVIVDADSLYSSMVNKLNGHKEFLPVIKYLVDSIAQKSIYDAPNQYIFAEPLKYLTKIDLDSNYLVIAELVVQKQLLYFLIKHDSIASVKEFSTYREIVLNRKVEDWNNDGKTDLFEEKRYDGQCYTTKSDAVYSFDNDKMNLIFCIEKEVVDCVTTSPKSTGRITQRSYKKHSSSGQYIITEINSECDCNKKYGTPLNKISTHTYKKTSEELVNEYGESYQ